MNESKSNTRSIILSIVLTAIGVLLVIFIVFQIEESRRVNNDAYKTADSLQNKTPDQGNYDIDKNINNVTEEDIITDDLKTFTDDSAGYSFKYGPALSLTTDINKLRLLPVSSPLGTLHEAFRTQALKDKESLKQGKLGLAAWSLPESKRLIKLNNGSFGQTYLIFQSLDVCSVRFDAIIEFFNGWADEQINITVAGPVTDFEKFLPEYFKNDPGCGLVWRDGKKLELYRLLESGSAPEKVQQWYDEFNKVVNSLEVK